MTLPYRRTYVKKAQEDASTSVAGNNRSTDVSGERQNIGDGSEHIEYEICINP
jgi:hypothetical protein